MSTVEIEPAGTALPESVLIPEMGNDPRWLGIARSIGMAAAKTTLAVVALSPVAAGAGVTSIYVAPEARVPVSIAGADVTASLDTGSNVINTNIQPFMFRRYSNAKVGTKDMGVNIEFHYTNVDLGGKTGGYDMDKIKAISQEFSNLNPEKKLIQDAVVNHYVNWGLGGVGFVYGAGAAIYGYSRLRKRQRSTYSEEKLTHALEDSKWPARFGKTVVAVSAASMVTSGATIYFAPNHPSEVVVDHNLDNTILKGNDVRGPAKQALDSFLPLASKYMKDKNGFYHKAERNLQIAFMVKNGSLKLKHVKGQITLVIGDDPQGEEGPLSLVGDYARYSDATTIVMLGDQTATGLALETPVMDVLKAHADGIPVQMSMGHHDSTATIKTAQERGFSVANGEVQRVGGVNFIGVNAPVPITFGEQDPLHDPTEVNHELAQSIIKKICSTKDFIIPEMHDIKIAEEVAASECAPILFGGRSFKALPPRYVGKSLLYTSGSTGGHNSENVPEVYGIIRADATFQAVTLDSRTGELLDSQIITLKANKNADVTITDNMPTNITLPAPTARKKTTYITMPPPKQRSRS